MTIHETDIDVLARSGITIDSPSPVHGIPYSDLNLRGWVRDHNGLWAQIKEMEYPIGITAHFMHGRERNGSNYSWCVKNNICGSTIENPSREFDLSYILTIHSFLNGTYRGTFIGIRATPSAASCMFA